ncbi:hypothetical protein ACFQ1E_08150 [Sphingomonas canadensis]|uniref:Uncharacterized protein n=1 Tax=Sphingomonas canadensis TaxID=1219257 RepID=A0ABW3H4Z3_9SPHN|nr:hypothetical protein [Sphingomonas canadensis]MCW3836008.1 hypothetical protein [Sphingomonas canadensis]
MKLFSDAYRARRAAKGQAPIEAALWFQALMASNFAALVLMALVAWGLLA